MSYGLGAQLASALGIKPHALHNKFTYRKLRIGDCKTMADLIAQAEKIGIVVGDTTKAALLKNATLPVVVTSAPRLPVKTEKPEKTPVTIGHACDVRGAIVELTQAERIIIGRIRSFKLNTIPQFESHVIEALNLLRGRSE